MSTSSNSSGLLWDELQEPDKEVIRLGIFVDHAQAPQLQDLEKYFKYYNDQCQLEFNGLQETPLPITSHKEVVEVIRILTENWDKDRKHLYGQLECDELEYLKGQEPDIKNYTIMFCLRLWWMANFRHELDNKFLTRTAQVMWEDDSTPLKSFLGETIFQFRKAPDIAVRNIHEKFCAAKIKEKSSIGLGMEILFTNNLIDHLKADDAEGNEKDKTRFYVFINISFLHAQRLKRSQFRHDNPLLPDPEKFFIETLKTINLLVRKSPNVFEENITPSDRTILDHGDYQPSIYTHEYEYYGSRLHKLNSPLTRRINLASTSKGPFKGPFQIEIYSEVSPVLPILENSLSEAPSLTQDKRFRVGPPPKTLVQFNAIYSWSPLSHWIYSSSKSRYGRDCPRLLASSMMGLYKHGYILVAIFDNHHTANEHMIQFKSPYISEQELFSEIHKSYKKLYSWRRFVSLKCLTGFSLYCCEHDYEFGFHSRPDHLDFEAKIALAQLFKVYSWPEAWLPRPVDNMPTAWATWIFKNFNGGSGDPRKSPHGLGLELVIGWSGKRIVALTVLLVIASLVIGIVYGVVRNDTQTGWTIASYVITATGVLAAILAILWARDNSRSLEPANMAMLARTLQSQPSPPSSTTDAQIQLTAAPVAGMV